MKRLLAWLFVVLAALLAGAAPAAAVTTPAQIAEKLRRAGLVIDASLQDAVPDAQRRAVLRAIDAAPYPVWIALVPLTAGDRYGGDSRRFLSVLHGRLGRDGVYVTVNERLLTARAYGVDDDEQPDLEKASTVANFESDDFDEPQIDKVRRFVEVLRAPDLAARYARTEARLAERRERSPLAPSQPREKGEDGDSGAGWVLPVGVGLVALLALGGLPLARRRRHARPAPEDAPVIPARVFEHARTAQAGDLREEIEERLVAFAEHVDRAEVPAREAAQERQQHALDAYAAARRVLQLEPRMVDLVGALVLVEDGSRALAAAEALEAGRPAPSPAPLCFFDPRHPGETRPVAWKPSLTVAACPACTAELSAQRPPDALLDAGHPWFEADSLWARTGFGAFEADLAQRVLRGELRR